MNVWPPGPASSWSVTRAGAQKAPYAPLGADHPCKDEDERMAPKLHRVDRHHLGCLTDLLMAGPLLPLFLYLHYDSRRARCSDCALRGVQDWVDGRMAEARSEDPTSSRVQLRKSVKSQHRPASAVATHD
jgi:hypothetical protein